MRRELVDLTTLELCDPIAGSQRSLSRRCACKASRVAASPSNTGGQVTRSTLERGRGCTRTMGVKTPRAGRPDRQNL